MIKNFAEARQGAIGVRKGEENENWVQEGRERERENEQKARGITRS